MNENVKSTDELLTKKEQENFMAELKIVTDEYKKVKKQYYDRYYRWCIAGLISVLICNVVGYFATGTLKHIAFILLLILCGVSLFNAFRNHEKVIAKRFRKYYQSKTGEDCSIGKIN